jgi:Tol biopolymer transport system component/DNA-binding winged helix-turn-helix (wHTH) protein
VRDQISRETKGLYEFREFHLDLTEKVLLRNGSVIPITPKVFETLQVFIEYPGRLIEKVELMQKLWQDQFVEESNLTFNIKMLRKALGDSASKPRFIETVPKRGYRFIAEVSRVKDVKEEIVRKDERQENFGSPGPHHFSAHQTPASAAVVALADWRHKPDEHKPVEIAPGNSPAKLELLPAIPIVDRKSNYYFFIMAGVILAVALTGFGLYKFSGSTASATDFQKLRLTSNGKTKLAALSPDGKYFAYVLDNEGKQSLWLKNIATGSDVSILPESENVSFGRIVFSPDGDHIFYGATGNVYRIPVLGGTPKKILSGPGSMVSFSPDGKQITFMRYSSQSEETAAVVIANIDGTDEKILASSRRPNIFLRSAAWSPDGKVIACIAMDAEGYQQVVTVNVADGAISTLPASRWNSILQIAWQPDGNSLIALVAETNILFQIWSLPYPGGEGKKITDDAQTYLNFSLSADGKSMVAVQAALETHLWLLPTGEEASRAKQLTHGVAKYDGFLSIHWAGDNRIIFENAPNGHPAGWSMDAEGQGLKEILPAAYMSAASPDGNFLVYQSKEKDGTGLFRYSVKDAEKKRLTTNADIFPAISPDGKWVVFERFSDDMALWKVPLDGGEAIKFEDVPGFLTYPAISPDGKFIALIYGGVSKAPSIVIVPTEGGKIVNEFNVQIESTPNQGKIALQWTPDGQAINYVSLVDNVSNIWRQPIDGGPPVQVTNFESGRIFNFAYSPHGEKLALSRGSFNRDVVLISKVSQ